MTQKHTAGQWQVFEEVKAHPITKRDGIQYVIRTVGGRGSNWRVIARTPRHTGKEKAAENAANARLIAAASDLLSACEMALTYCKFPVGAQKAKVALQDAIAKAKGSEQ